MRPIPPPPPITESRPPAAATQQQRAAFGAVFHAPPPRREPRAPGMSRARLVAVAVAWGLAIVAGATLLEWGGWQVVWRGGEPRLLDAHWRGMFVAGVGRNAAGAVGVGAISAVAALAIARSRPHWRARARRLAVLAFGGGSILFIAAVAAMVQLAP